jgi:hypothetical protein
MCPIQNEMKNERKPLLSDFLSVLLSDFLLVLSSDFLLVLLSDFLLVLLSRIRMGPLSLISGKKRGRGGGGRLRHPTFVDEQIPKLALHDGMNPTYG